MPVLCCYAKRRRSSPAIKSPEQYRREIPGMALARLDEFESLTPLMMMPGGSTDDAPSTRRYCISSIASQSPPPPRRLTNGKTLIVPLNSGKGRTPFVPLLATPDSKGAPLENGGMKGCSAITEDEENVPISSNLDKADADFISIDRTTASYFEPRQQRLQQCECGIPKQDKAPIFELPTPSYAPPPLPVLLVRSPRRKFRCGLILTDLANCLVTERLLTSHPDDHISLMMLQANDCRVHLVPDLIAIIRVT
uniref:Uncharacterized protein n=1 Tax=Setaria digitata TaxID=48799 RepID=A0A915Q0Q7_9BILA